MRIRIIPILAVFAASAAADVVHLENGNTFEGVVSEITETQVTIRLSFGELGLSRKSVARIERSESTLGTYLERRERLAASAAASAADWLELATWAQLRGLGGKAAEAARMAAAFDPGVEGLERLFAGLGYVYDEALRRWVPYEDFMHRRGFVKESGEWVSSQVLEARSREAEREARDRREEARESRLQQVVELLALAQLERLQAEREAPPPVQTAYPSYPVATFPGYWPGYVGGGAIIGRPSPPIHPRPVARPLPVRGSYGGFSDYAPSSWNDVARRQPGSIIPLQPVPAPMSGGR